MSYPEQTSDPASADGTVFGRLRVTPVINACGIFTDLGGSVLSAEIWAALTELNGYFVDLPNLLDRSGERIAELLRCEAARITAGASAAIALAVAVCLVDKQAHLGQQLPDTTGLRNTLLMQRAQADAYKYLGAVRITGADVVLVGAASGTTEEELVGALDRNTACVFVPAHLDDLPGCLRIEDVCRCAHERGIPVVVDAAYVSFPPEIMRSFSERGADLTCFSSKYFGGPNAGGFVSGRQDLIDAVRLMDFTHHESGSYRRFGRPFKQGRYEIAAVQLALEEWHRVDHSVRLGQIARRAERLADLLARHSGLSIQLRSFTLDNRLTDGPVNAAVVTLKDRVAVSSRQVIERLAAGHPSIRAIEFGEVIVLVTDTLRDGDEQLIAARLCEAVSRG